MRNIFLSLLAAAVISSPAGATCQVGKLLEFKVTMRGTKAVADIGINGRTLPFIIDSGAFFSAISPGTAKELGLRVEPTALTVRGIGGTAGRAYVTRVKTVDLGGIPLHDIDFMVAGSEFGVGGLIGQNILGIGDVEYDLGHGVIRLMRSKGCSANDNLAYWSGNTPVSDMPIDFRDIAHPHTIGAIWVNGQRLRAIFDTGATSILSLSAARNIGIKPSSPGVVPAGIARGIGRDMVQSWLTPIASVKIGTEEVRNVKMHMNDVELQNADMLIGADFFVSHRVYVSNALRRMYFTYTGGPVFNTMPSGVVDDAGKAQTIAADTSPQPIDAAGFSRRGAAEMARSDLKAAIADFDRAVAMAPTNGNYLIERAKAQLQAHNNAAAFADIDRAAQVAPTDPQIRVMHAKSLIARKRHDEAVKDLQAADSILSPVANDRLALAVLFGMVDQLDRSIANFDQWINAHPDDSGQPVALSGRCWARALAGRDLPLALKDCNAAMRRGQSAGFFNSRGLVELRMGQYDKAIDDYTHALLLNPRLAWSLYGRGLAWRHKNNPSAQQDLDAAAAIDPAVRARAQALGIN